MHDMYYIPTILQLVVSVGTKAAADVLFCCPPHCYMQHIPTFKHLFIRTNTNIESSICAIPRVIAKTSMGSIGENSQKKIK